MAGNSFGELFRVTTFGESHGGGVGVVVDGCPPGLSISEEDIQIELDRRKPGQSGITSPRQEEDTIRIYSGVFEGCSTGTPILLMAGNKDARPQDYYEMSRSFRPGHADFTYQKKYGRRDWQGSGRASARETLARVAAGAIARKYLVEQLGVEIVSYVEQIGTVKASLDYRQVKREHIESNAVRCPDPATATVMFELVQSIKVQGDSIGAVVFGAVKNMPIGLGEPVFDKLHADLGKAMLSINAVKGFEIGSGFASATMRGSEHNDSFEISDSNQIITRTNNAGGVLGGISNGADIVFRVAFKPVATIALEQQTVTIDNELTTLKAAGRHDPCVAPRAVPIVDAMTAIVIMDHYLRHKAQNS